VFEAIDRLKADDGCNSGGRGGDSCGSRIGAQVDAFGVVAVGFRSCKEDNTRNNVLWRQRGRRCRPIRGKGPGVASIRALVFASTMSDVEGACQGKAPGDVGVGRVSGAVEADDGRDGCRGVRGSSNPGRKYRERIAR